MPTIKMKKTKDQYVRGRVYIVDKDEAHRLIDGGFAVLVKQMISRKNKMMVSGGNKKRYKTKG